jgi:hypothetical protein
VVCMNCHNHVMTAVTSSPSSTSWLCCIGLCFVGAGRKFKGRAAPSTLLNPHAHLRPPQQPLP